MAISPKDAARSLDSKIAKAIDKLEPEIDRQLAEKWHTGCGGVYVSVDTETYRLPTIAGKLAEKYATLGWIMSPIGNDTPDKNVYRIFMTHDGHK